jgi:REP element-mobilizing transposase RayT
MRWPAVELSDAARRVVEQTLADHAALRGWQIFAANARRTHVHVVVENAGVDPDAMMDQFKAWTTRRQRDGGHVAPGARVWTRGASTRYLWTAASLNAAIEYVREGQDVPR